MSVFVIGLLNGMIYQPSGVWLSEQWAQRNINVFINKIKKQCMIILAISIICIVGASFIGIPVLSIVYNTDLRNFWKELVVLQFAGMFLAISGYMNLLLTIMRMKNVLLIGYAIIFFFSLVGMKYMACTYGTVGVCLYYLFCMCILTWIYFFILFKRFKMELVAMKGKM